MSKYMIAIDGASRRNGKEDCISSGGVYIRDVVDDSFGNFTEMISKPEYGSTNQRGELIALRMALHFLAENESEQAIIITDSEYIFNAITKEWIIRWNNNGWLTAEGNSVKNKDLWEEIYELYSSLDEDTVTLIHLKGHILSVGKGTGQKILDKDHTGITLYNAFCEIADNPTTRVLEMFDKAQALSLQNNGFEFSKEQLIMYASMNGVVDAIATECVDAANDAD